MEDTEMRRRIDAAFEFIGRVAEHPDRFSDETVLFLMDPAEVASAVTKERLRILRELVANEYPSFVALARALGRDVSRVRKDLLALRGLGLVAFSKSRNRIRAKPTATGIYIPLFAPTRSRHSLRAAASHPTGKAAKG